MKTSEKFIETGDEGQRFAAHAHVEKSDSPYGGLSLRITTTYEDTRKPDEHRTVFQQHFQSQAEYDKFAAFIASQASR